MLKRAIEDRVQKYLKTQDHKIFFIWGPRRSGKTTLLTKIGQQLRVPVFNFDLQSDREKFLPDIDVLKKLVTALPVILIDEVQSYPESTLALKILFDTFETKIIATGSSELRQKAGQGFDSLAGRFVETYCLPLSVTEIADQKSPKTYAEKEFTRKLQETVQMFGNYPEIYDADLSENAKIDVLQNILDTYILKDVVHIYELKNTKLAKDILTKIALQIGQEVSMREIANSLQANVATVANYIEIFIKNYILIPLPSFKTNLRQAVSEHRKLFFYDLGIRNMLVQDFRPSNLRPDKGGVFENFIVSELEKHRRNNNLKLNMYFYREYGGREVDIVLEDYHKKYTCVEIKYLKPVTQSPFPLPHKFQVIDTHNYFEVISSVSDFPS